MKIESVSIRAVRGVREEVTLDLAGKSLLLKGDNGTGKSSIVRALIWALCGDEAPSGSGKRVEEEDYRQHILADPADPRVRVKLRGGSTIEVTPGSVESDRAGDRYRDGCRRTRPFLLRKQLVRFLEDKPSDRYKYLESFLDVEQVDEIKDNLDNRVKALDAETKKAASTNATAIRRVADSLPAPLRAAATTWDGLERAFVSWATALKAAAGVSRWDHVLDEARRLETTLRGDTLARRRVALESVRDALCSWTAPVHLAADLAAERTELRRLEESTTDARLSKLLDEALQHIASTPGRCPVCHYPIEASTLVDELRARRATLDELREMRTALDARGHGCRREMDRWRVLVDDSLRLLGGAAPEMPPTPSGIEAIDAGTSGHELVERIAGPTARGLVDCMITTVRQLEQRVREQIECLPVEANVDELRIFVQAVHRAEAARPEIDATTRAHAVARKRASDLSVVADAVRKARQDVVRKILDEIGTLVREFYESLHPRDGADEATGFPRISLKRHGDGTAFVHGEFHLEHVADPRWVYSDGHLDTVGICVFLAMRRHRADSDPANDPRLMVLDDIVLSVDLIHGERLLKLLKSRFGDHQVLIFTHNGLFFDWCTRHLHDYKRRIIRQWTIETGPQLGDHRSNLERLRGAIETETSEKALAQAATNAMDEWLAEARIAYAVAVPARPADEYTLTQIWEPFASRMRKLEREWRIPLADCSRRIAELEGLPHLRNRLGAHDNEFAREFPLTSVRSTAEKVLALIATLYCEGCRQFVLPGATRDPESVRCECGTLSYKRAPEPSVPSE